MTAPQGVAVGLRDSGLLWLINRTVFHPRGFGLAMVFDDDGHHTGFILYGDGTEPWSFPVDDEPALFEAAERAFAAARAVREVTP